MIVPDFFSLRNSTKSLMKFLIPDFLLCLRAFVQTQTECEARAPPKAVTLEVVSCFSRTQDPLASVSNVKMPLK